MRRRHLLDVARRLFISQGFHQTGVAQIATESGIKVGQIYRDFQSKEAIIAAICDMDMAAWLEEDVLAAAVKDGDLPAIRSWLTRFNQPGDMEEYRLLAEIMAEAGRNPSVAESFSATDRRVRNSLSAALVAILPGQTDPAVIESLAELVLTLGIGLASRRIVQGEDRCSLGSRIIERVITGEARSFFDCRESRGLDGS
ncbi:TetR/AcrR family transcriptional regulator [Sphingobium sp. DC-2]|uniref:TetR/AcrR family transcriptional regulator n=1 Tax=Sphingobium sp. DC-2 TaxID=1303256 RepID=UPI00068B35A0|nr:TetR/AcrR family transcriptional regulator [Sphingobium sp. DC-2]